MAEKLYNKVICGNKTLMDLTSDTVSEDKVLDGFTFHDKTGALKTGSCKFDVDSTDATVAVAEMLDGKTAYARGTKLAGTMPNRGGVNGTIATKDGTFTIPQGYHDGSGKVGLDPTEKAKIIGPNIRKGVVLFGQEGEMTGTEDANPQSKTVTPTMEAQTILPDEGYNYLSQVVVNAIPYVETPNAAGGITVTIG